jgi:hypothetical protein
MVERVRHGDYRTPPIAAGGNILMHGQGRYTASGLQQIIDAVRAKGLVLDWLVAPPNRTDTAAAVARRTHPDGAATVYLATGWNFPDALAGGPAAAADDAPMLLLRHDAVPEATAEELRRLGPSTVVILGGLAAVSERTEREVKALTGATVRRLAGAKRADTAAAVAANSHPETAATVYLATGDNFPDALASSPAAARVDRAPILLLSRDAIPEATARELERLAPERVVILGGPAAVSEATAAEVAERTGAAVERLDGRPVRLSRRCVPLQRPGGRPPRLRRHRPRLSRRPRRRPRRRQRARPHPPGHPRHSPRHHRRRAPPAQPRGRHRPRRAGGHQRPHGRPRRRAGHRNGAPPPRRLLGLSGGRPGQALTSLWSWALEGGGLVHAFDRGAIAER